MARFRRRSCVALLALALVLLVVVVFLKSFGPEDSRVSSGFGRGLSPRLSKPEKIPILPVAEAAHVKTKASLAGGAMNLETLMEEAMPKPNYNLHAFYYTWYGSPTFDGKFIHWNHPLLKHWDPKVAAGYPEGNHSPPDDIGANFYPALGPYSSRDPSVIDHHMQQLRAAAVGVLAVSWYPPGMKDDNGESTDDIVPLVLDAAHEYEIKVAFHIEPYGGRDETNMFENVKYIVEKYGDHAAFFRHETRTGQSLPLFYVYDSYLLSSQKWAQLLKPSGKTSIRNTPYDGVFVALLVEDKHKKDIVASGFDGVYTYFATNGFSYGSTYRNWRSIKSFCDENGLMFIPSVGPGYIDTSIRPWNSQNTRNRINGKYYETALSAAVEAGARVISITSFNEWHEGSQIEMAVPKAGHPVYQDYLPHRPSVYLEVTRKWAKKIHALASEKV
ncbi:glycoprotein endo-alpha-1,2-mannosidase [Denticeps clupeoides]|uniref:Glycoprotein endo-alpha-1,2-mannosidase n=1 Tax=Denticeps clupeoides TaxID=299321 RepID=A0AAY4AP90_9TELE|nr:glycoprotein endo-alpha-1,2-mannosidase-like [Denticeps clupeoides]